MQPSPPGRSDPVPTAYPRADPPLQHPVPTALHGAPSPRVVTPCSHRRRESRSPPGPGAEARRWLEAAAPPLPLHAISGLPHPEHLSPTSSSTQPAPLRCPWPQGAKAVTSKGHPAWTPPSFQPPGPQGGVPRADWGTGQGQGEERAEADSTRGLRCPQALGRGREAPQIQPAGPVGRRGPWERLLSSLLPCGFTRVWESCGEDEPRPLQGRGTGWQGSGGFWRGHLGIPSVPTGLPPRGHLQATNPRGPGDPRSWSSGGPASALPVTHSKSCTRSGAWPGVPRRPAEQGAEGRAQPSSAWPPPPPRLPCLSSGTARGLCGSGLGMGTRFHTVPCLTVGAAGAHVLRGWRGVRADGFGTYFSFCLTTGGLKSQGLEEPLWAGRPGFIAGAHPRPGSCARGY